MTNVPDQSEGNQTQRESDQRETAAADRKETPRKSGISNRGFASMDAAKQRAIASKGGQAAHAQGKAHEFSSEEARIAGRKGGQAAHARGTAHQFSSEEARRAGHKSRQRHQHKSSSDNQLATNRYDSSGNRYENAPLQ